MYPTLNVEGYTKDMFPYLKKDAEGTTIGAPTLDITFYFQDDSGKTLEQTVSKEIVLKWFW